MVQTLTNANPRETDKIKTHYARIVVDGTAEKPYYSIEWYDHTKNEHFLGYSSYNIDYVFKWLEECFEIVEAPKTNAQKIRAMSDEAMCNWLFQRDCTNIAAFLEYGGMGVMNAVQLLEWLQKPSE